MEFLSSCLPLPLKSTPNCKDFKVVSLRKKKKSTFGFKCVFWIARWFELKDNTKPVLSNIPSQKKKKKEEELIFLKEILVIPT